MTEHTFRVRLSDVPAHPKGHGKGTLSVFEGADLPFRVDRVFTVTGLAAGERRAEHANEIVYEAISCVRGAIGIWTHDGVDAQEWELSTPHQLLEVPPGTWIVLTALEDDTAFVVLANHTYAVAKQHYITDFARFLRAYGAAPVVEPLSP